MAERAFHVAVVGGGLVGAALGYGMETYGGPEAWYSRGTVGIAGTKGTEDLPLPENVRRYYHAGTTHGGGAGGFNLGTASTDPNVLAANPNPQREINRALYVDMAAAQKTL